MKCPKCSVDNKATAKFCSQCGTALSAAPASLPKAPKAPEPSVPLWRPDWRWHLRALGGIFALLIVAYFAISLFLSKVPSPFKMRDIPKEMTPWLNQ